MTAPEQQAGRWDAVFALPNVAIHTHVLPNGKVLFWGRRDNPGDTLNEHVCTPQVWDPATGATTPTSQPRAADGTTVNLFCAGHAFLPDGRLLVAGGHWADFVGINQACLYDWTTGTWTALPPMKQARWYPTVTTLADGRALVSSGSIDGANAIADPPQIWDGTQWGDAAPFPSLPLYPRTHVVPGGRVFMSGSNAQTYFLDTAGAGGWTPLPLPGGARPTGLRDYAPSVQYEPNKVIYIGGGNDPGTRLPSADTELIDLAAATPGWLVGAAMAFRRRQHNGTILADGTVLVTGGTRGPDFNDVSPGMPVHEAELWNPATGTWRTLAAEGVDRCYHSTSVLLPDATVLSAGGGEYNIGLTPNPVQDNHRDAQIFYPPYLFAGPRPEIVSVAGDAVAQGGNLAVEIGAPDAAARITMVRLPSVTHAFDQNQRLVVPALGAAGTTLTVTVPADPGVCPPGHYMLFVLSGAGVPSVARIVRVDAAPGQQAPPPAALAALAATAPATSPTTATVIDELDAAVRRGDVGTPVRVGLTSRCPYGLGACWGGAYEALGTLDDVAAVHPVPNGADSTAEVYLTTRGLPDLDRWPEEIARWANASYDFRGVEVTLDGVVTEHEDGFALAVPDLDADLRLQPLTPATEIRWDLGRMRLQTPSPDELGAYDGLRFESLARPLRVAGPLRHTDGGWMLSVRTVEAPAG